MTGELCPHSHLKFDLVAFSGLICSESHPCSVRFYGFCAVSCYF
uniref:Uncharacterized protein n=1 Tax=Anguilla anguilla TaxID=7936 RepID=A0A0E9PA07_ANGAN